MDLTYSEPVEDDLGLETPPGLPFYCPTNTVNTTLYVLFITATIKGHTCCVCVLGQTDKYFIMEQNTVNYHFGENYHC